MLCGCVRSPDAVAMAESAVSAVATVAGAAGAAHHRFSLSSSRVCCGAICSNRGARVRSQSAAQPASTAQCSEAFVGTAVRSVQGSRWPGQQTPAPAPWLPWPQPAA